MAPAPADPICSPPPTPSTPSRSPPVPPSCPSLSPAPTPSPSSSRRQPSMPSSARPPSLPPPRLLPPVPDLVAKARRGRTRESASKQISISWKASSGGLPARSRACLCHRGGESVLLSLTLTLSPNLPLFHPSVDPQRRPHRAPLSLVPACLPSTISCPCPLCPLSSTPTTQNRQATAGIPPQPPPTSPTGGCMDTSRHAQKKCGACGGWQVQSYQYDGRLGSMKPN